MCTKCMAKIYYLQQLFLIHTTKKTDKCLRQKWQNRDSTHEIIYFHCQTLLEQYNELFTQIC